MRSNLKVYLNLNFILLWRTKKSYGLLQTILGCATKIHTVIAPLNKCFAKKR